MKIEENIYLCKTKNISKNKDLIIYYLDYLRIFCSFFVILIHVSSNYYYNSALHSYKWKIAFYYNALSRFSVPNFFMISGSLFLNRDLSYKIIFIKYIKNIFIHLILWSIIYSLINTKVSTLNIKMTLLEIIKGHYHLWYLFTIIGIYITTPFWREIAKNDRLLNYFIALYFIISFIIPNSIYILSYYSKDIYELLTYLNFSFHLDNIYRYNYYFIIGHYLNKKNTGKIIRIIIYTIGFISFILTSTIAYNFAIIKNQKIHHFSSIYLNNFFYSISIFLFFKNNCNNLKLKKKNN